LPLIIKVHRHEINLMYLYLLHLQDIQEVANRASINDCILRSVGLYSLAVIVDVDEFIIPKKHRNLVELVNSQGDYDSYTFKVRLMHYSGTLV